MIYWINSMKDGSFLGAASTYEEAVEKQNHLYDELGIDSYIEEEYYG